MRTIDARKYECEQFGARTPSEFDQNLHLLPIGRRLFSLAPQRRRRQPLANMKEFEAFLDTDEIVVVGTFAEKRSKAFENFKAVAEGDLSISYGVSFDPEVMGGG